jgi:hypothetical protein
MGSGPFPGHLTTTSAGPNRFAVGPAIQAVRQHSTWLHMDNTTIYKILFAAISGFIAVGGIYLLTAPKKTLENLSKHNDVINRYGKVLGEAMSYKREDGTIVSRPPAWHYRLTGVVLAIVGCSFLWFALHG